MPNDNQSSIPILAVRADQLAAVPSAIKSQVEVIHTAFSSINQQMAEAVETVQQSLQNQFADLALAMRRAIIEPLAKTLEAVDERLQQMEPAAHALGRSGWTVPVWGPLFLAEDLFQVAKPEQFDCLFEEEYAANRKKLEGEMFERLLAAPSLARWAAL